MNTANRLLILGLVALSLAACARLNPFAEKDVILPGERRPVFGPGDSFAGPRKLPPPNSDVVGATVPAGGPPPPAAAPAPPPPAR